MVDGSYYVTPHASQRSARSSLHLVRAFSAGGSSLPDRGGKVVGLDGRPPPKRVAITEWDSLEQAEAFIKSKAWTDLGPDRDKAIKTIRRYAVEAVN